MYTIKKTNQPHRIRIFQKASGTGELTTSHKPKLSGLLTSGSPTTYSGYQLALRFGQHDMKLGQINIT